MSRAEIHEFPVRATDSALRVGTKRKASRIETIEATDAACAPAAPTKSTGTKRRPMEHLGWWTPFLFGENKIREDEISMRFQSGCPTESDYIDLPALYGLPPISKKFRKRTLVNVAQKLKAEAEYLGHKQRVSQTYIAFKYGLDAGHFQYWLKRRHPEI